MKVTILKYGNTVSKVDFSDEIKGLEDETARFFIGRSEKCHLVLDDQMISRELAELIYDNNNWRIKSLSTNNDISINGQITNDSALADGDVLKISDFTLNIEIGYPTQIDDILEEDDDLTTEMESPALNTAEIESPNINTSEIETTENQELIDTTEEPEDETDFITTEDVEEPGESYDESLEVEASNGEFDEGEYTEDSTENEYDYDNEQSNDEGYDIETLDDGKTGIITSFAKYKLEIFGENAPYDSFLLPEGETFIGRNQEKCQIILNDPEVSSVHAVINKKGSICILEDLQSGNGTLLKGERINKVGIENADEFIIGGTTFTLRVGSNFLVEERDSLMPVEKNQFIEVEEVVEVDPNLEDGVDFEENEEKSIIKRIWKDPVKRKKAIYVLFGVVLLWLFLEEDPENVPAKQKSKVVKNDPKALKKKGGFAALSLAKRETVESLYLSSKELVNTGKHIEALDYLTELHKIIPVYKESKQLEDVAKRSLEKIAELEKKKQLEIEKKIRAEKIKILVEKAKIAVKERNVQVANQLFDKISEIDPNNFDIPLLKGELDAWIKEEDRKRIAATQKKAERNRKEKALVPGRNLWLRKDWFNAIVALDKFLNIQEMDDDLVKEATTMLEESRSKLLEVVDPLVGKARSLLEGQDLKGAYEEYRKVLKFDPTHIESLDEMDRIRELLTLRSRKVYREAILSESLSLFDQAKEKYQELQQISPSDSEYYKKATDKLKDYLE